MTIKRFPWLLRALIDSDEALKIRRNGPSIDIVAARSRRVIRLSSRAAVYCVDVGNCFDYYFDSVEPAHEKIGGTPHEVVDFSVPQRHELRGFNDFPVMFPSLSEPYATAAQYLGYAGLSHGDVVLDLGAYSGLTSVLFSQKVGSRGKVVAVEPDPINSAVAAINIAAHLEINKLDNIHLDRAAVMAYNGVVSFSSEGSMGSAPISITGQHRGERVDVAAKKLDDLATEHDLQRVDFIKMDIEGSEEPVLASSGAFLDRFRPKLMIEPHLVKGVLSTDAVCALLTQRGYHCEIVDQVGVGALPLITACPKAMARAA